jgi:3-oxoadipate enol-lactonase
VSPSSPPASDLTSTLLEPSVPLLLLHGAESGRSQFDDLIPALDPSIRAWSYDQRDTIGEHDGDYTMADLADDAADILRGQPDGTGHVLGTSFGGAVAQHLALRHPGRVRSLTLLSTTADRRAVERYRTATAAIPEDERRMFALDGAVSPGARRADPALEQRLLAALVPRTATRRSRRMRALDDHDTTSELPHISVPTLVIHGDADTVIPWSSGRVLADRIPGARLETIEGGRHGLAFEFRSRIAALVSEFVLTVEDTRS